MRILAHESQYFKGIANDTLDGNHFIVTQLAEFTLPPPLREFPIVLANVSHQVFGKPIRHFGNIQDSSYRVVMMTEVVDLARQILIHCAPHIGV
jgi:hypothetical protein